jgi:predicted dehydrogenase
MKKASRSTKFSRRHFLALTGAAIAAPNFIPASALGRAGSTAPSERVVMGMIGCGWQGGSNMGGFLGNSACQVVAVCDVDKNHLQGAKNTVDKKYNNQDCKTYSDFRELCARKDIDGVMLALPDHWHALVAVEAANHGKDIYGEKPLARTIAEQQAIVKAVQKNKRIWQTGSWQRSERHFHYASEIVRNGLIGKIKRVEVGLPAGHSDFAQTKGKNQATTPPPELDWETWIGPSKMEPYIESRVHKNWRWNYNTGGGQLLDWIGHHCDIAHWGMDCDRSGPSEVEGKGEFPPADAVWNTCTKYRINAKYPNDIEMVIAGGHSDIKSGTKWIGSEGWVWVDRGNAVDASDEKLKDTRKLPDNLRKVKLYESSNHIGNFLDCVKSRQPTITPVETAHHSAIPGHLGLIAMLVGHGIKWDVKKEVIVGDKEASKLLTRPFRKPWHLAGV